ncbi:MAG TPA: SIMPL domain-containing protein [Vicinamibacterales bacterium]|nr:SIMPL domain-containing protein [Vicinamibacterales bacterium]
MATADDVSKIATSSSATIRVPAYKARFTVGVTSKGDRAKDAGAKVAAVLSAVRDALVRLGLDRSGLASAGYAVSTDYNEQTRQPKGYIASSSLAVELVNLDQLGAVVDAALAAGATEVSQIGFLPKDGDEARNKALELAFSEARRDAEVLARASGQHLGRLLTLSTNRSFGGAISETITAIGVGTGTEIPAPEVAISATVQAEWLLEPGT